MMDERMELIWARVGLPATTLKSRLREAPLYFNDQQLTAEQRARWPWAVQEYTKVIRQNIEHQMARMSASDKESMLRSFPLHRRANRLDDDVREILHMFYGMSGGEGGDGHSALFARLLDGKPALDRPPPSSFHRPWYALVEEDGPFAVQVTDAHMMAVDGEVEAEGVAGYAFLLGINECPWEVEESNGPGRALLVLHGELEQHSHADGYGWTKRLHADVLAAYRADPRFIVRHDDWPPYELKLASPESSKGPAPLEALTQSTVFDAGALGYAVDLMDSQNPGEKLQFQWSGWLLERTGTKPFGSVTE